MKYEEILERNKQTDFYDLGISFSTGKNSYIDLTAAHFCFNISAITGNKKAAARRAELAEEMSKDELNQAQRYARKWLSSQEASPQGKSA